MKSKKWVLITGASTGIGRATAEYLASNGFGVYAGARKQKDLEELNKIENVQGIKLDVTKDDDVQAAKNHIIGQNTGLYGLVNNAGINYIGPLMELNTDEIIIPFIVNLIGVHRITKSLFPFLLESKGRIIMISSINGYIGLPFDGPYCVSKFALEGYSDTLRRELLKFDVKVSIIRPGFIKTIMWDKGEEQIEPLLRDRKDSIFYDSGVKLAESFLKEAKEKGIPPVKVAEVVFKALTSKKPKVRYLVSESNLRYRLANLLSDSRIDKIIKKML
jgi:short-subunit dehydrogenase